MHYNRLAATVSLVNLLTLIYGMSVGGWFSTDGIALGAIGNVTIINFTAAIVIRQHYVINFLFRVATSVPTHWPLRIRWTMGKVYHFGGIHVGGAVAGALWFMLYLGSVIYHTANGLPGVSAALVVVSVALIILLAAMIGFSLPRFRAKYHDNFEKMHRFGGWTALGPVLGPDPALRLVQPKRLVARPSPGRIVGLLGSGGSSYSASPYRGCG